MEIDNQKKIQKNNESFYRDWEELDILESDFQRFYNINLEKELENDDFSYRRFCNLVRFLPSDSFFRYIVNLRSEENMDKIKEMSIEEKRIRREWRKEHLGEENDNKIIEKQMNLMF